MRSVGKDGFRTIQTSPAKPARWMTDRPAIVVQHSPGGVGTAVVSGRSRRSVDMACLRTGVASPSRTLAVEGADIEGSLSRRAGQTRFCRFPQPRLGTDSRG